MSKGLDLLLDQDDQIYKKKIVKVKEEVLRGFPPLNLKERDLEITPPFAFSTIYYERPIGESNVGTVEVELISAAGDVISEKFNIEFKYSESERMEDAKLPESFSLRPEIIYTNNAESFVKDDFMNKYEDVVINKIKRLTPDEKMGERVQINFSFSNSRNRFANLTKKNNYSVIIPLDPNYGIELSAAQTREIEFNALKMADREFSSGAKMLISDLEHFEINPAFLKSSPPSVVDASFVIPKPYINLIKIDYIPPKSVDSLEAQVVVEYELNGRVQSDRVAVFFQKTIRQAVETLISQESVINFKYLPLARKVPPVSMDAEDFEYTGNLNLRIIGVEYDHESLDQDNRFINATIVLQYRMVVTKIVKRLEFQYSRNEYINGNWVSAKTENGSIIFEKTFISPDVFYSKIDAEKWEFTKPAELLKNATINAEYPYSTIKEIKLINFDPASRIVMFKVVAIELNGETKIVRTFEKHEKMPWSYNEWVLGNMTADDLLVDETLLPEYPTQKIDEKIFTKTKMYRVLSVQYIYPGDESKEVEMQVQVVMGERSKFITKMVTFRSTYLDHLIKVKKQDAINNLRNLRPSDLSLLIDLNSAAPDKITKEDVIGIPEGVETRVIYKTPRNGEKTTRIVIEFSVEKFVLGFEQTLTFSEVRK